MKNYFSFSLQTRILFSENLIEDILMKLIHAEYSLVGTLKLEYAIGTWDIHI